MTPDQGYGNERRKLQRRLEGPRNDVATQYRRLTIDVVLWGDDNLNSPATFMTVVKGLINALPFITVQNIRNEPHPGDTHEPGN